MNFKNINKFLIITDAKNDDSLAIKVFLRYISRLYSETSLHFLITDIVNRQGAANYVNKLCQTILKNDKTLVGKVNIIFHEGNEDPDAPKDKKVKTHEKMFIEYSKPEFTEETVPFFPINFSPKKYICFAIAPFQNHKELVTSAFRSYMGLGYNTIGLDLNFYCTVKGVMHFINNRSETIYPDKREGGRFSAADDELWEAVYKDTDGILEKTKKFALEDSKQFGIKQLLKQEF